MADVIPVMGKHHRNKVSEKFKDLLKGKRLVCLAIRDNYGRMQTGLIQLSEARVVKVVQLT